MNYQILRETIAARRNSFIFLAFLALMNLAALLYLSFWQEPELAKAQNDWFAQREALARGQRVGAAERYQAGARDLALFQQRLIPKKGFPGFLSELFATAKGHSLQLKGISYKPTPIKEEGLVSYGMAFTVSGKYASVKSFLAELAR